MAEDQNATNKNASNTEEVSQSATASKEDRSNRLMQRVLLGLFLLVLVAGFAIWYTCFYMPGESYADAGQSTQTEKPTNQEGSDSVTQDGSAEQESIDLPKELEGFVSHLADAIGERNLFKYTKLCEAADYIEARFVELGLATSRQTFQVNGNDCFNIEAEIRGSSQPDKIVIVGAHYDSVVGTPGANDNGSGTAAMLSLARMLKNFKPEKTLRFVAFTNEEPPWFHTRDMGSWVYAEKCSREKQDIVGVLSLETMGYFTDEEDSQKYPEPLNLMYPSTGNFIGFVSNMASAALQKRVIKVFREHAEVPSEGASLPESLPGVGWSDHWSFWQEGYAGIMVTDTAPFRYPHYHEPTDTPDKIDYQTLAKVVQGLKFVVEDLASDD